MTDTAQPLPSEINDPKTADGTLTAQQLQRAAALDIARAALISRTGLFGGQQVGSSFDVRDLLTVAEWVLNEPLIMSNPDTIMKAAPLPVALEHVQDDSTPAFDWNDDTNETDHPKDALSR